MPQAPSRGEVWFVNLDPTKGHEQAGARPVVIISTDAFNHGPSGLTVVVPLTRTERNVPLHVRVDPPEGGLSEVSIAMCDQLRTISRDRFRGAGRGFLSPDTMAEIEDRIRILLDL